MERESAVISAKDLSVGYPLGGGRLRRVHEGLSLALYPGGLTCLLGPNGAGKSTLMRTICGLQRSLGGEVLLDGRPIGERSVRERSRRIGVVLTDRSQAGGLRVRELVEMGRHPYTGFFGRLDGQDRRAVDEALRAVGVADKADSYVAELSDGERQKTMIAKVLAQQCPVILLDEPTAFLDAVSRIEVMDLLHRLAREQGKAVLMSTHDVAQALQLADRLWLLSAREGLLDGTPEDLVLGGQLDRFFSRDGIGFDPAGRGFRRPVGEAPAVRIETGDAVLRYWAQNALERNGFRVLFGKVEDEEKNIPVARLRSAGDIEWVATGGTFRFRSFGQWIERLNGNRHG